MKKFLLFAFLITISTLHAGEELPRMTLKDLNNRNVELADYLGKGPLVLDFWATWCKPCLKAMPKLQKLHQKYKEKGVHILAINEDGPRNQSKIKPFIKTRRITLPVLIDPNGELMRKLNVPHLPATFVINSEGIIVSQHIGYTNEIADELEVTIQELLKSGDE